MFFYELTYDLVNFLYKILVNIVLANSDAN